jgi:type VI secretion system protein ImpM
VSALALDRSTPGPGFFGKLPDRGDFVSRWLPKSFLDPWDAWLQGCIATSQEQLGPAWEGIYMTSPIWRFALPGQLFQGATVAGVLMPSVDRVGRCYPLTLAALFEQGPKVTSLPPQAGWYAQLEQTALAALDDMTTLEKLESMVEDIELPVLDELATEGVTSLRQGYSGGGEGALELHCGLAGEVPDYPGLLDHLLGQQFSSYSLWWSGGSDQVAPTTLVCSGLPEAASFGKLLDGRWHEDQPTLAPLGVKDDIDDLLA